MSRFFKTKRTITVGKRDSKTPGCRSETYQVSRTQGDSHDNSPQSVQTGKKESTEKKKTGPVKGGSTKTNAQVRGVTKSGSKGKREKKWGVGKKNGTKNERNERGRTSAKSSRSEQHKKEQTGTTLQDARKKKTGGFRIP